MEIDIRAIETGVGLISHHRPKPCGVCSRAAGTGHSTFG
jgi:hypothetical protein